MSELRIGKLAELAGMDPGTVRFYERAGLLEKPTRLPSGYRSYPAQAVARLQFIRSAKRLGFTLREIRELLDLRVDPVESCEEVRSIAASKLADVEARLRGLERIRASLTELVRVCGTRSAYSECPILEFLDQEDPT